MKKYELGVSLQKGKQNGESTITEGRVAQILRPFAVIDEGVNPSFLKVVCERRNEIGTAVFPLYYFRSVVVFCVRDF